MRVSEDPPYGFLDDDSDEQQYAIGERNPESSQSLLTWRLASRASLVICPILSGAVLAWSFAPAPPKQISNVLAMISMELDKDIPFKLLLSALMLAFSGVYAFANWVSRLVNDDGAEVDLGNNWAFPGYKGAHLFYCGREFPLPGSDGRCGPSAGPQCESCQRFQEAAKSKMLTPRSAGRLKELRGCFGILAWVAPAISTAVSMILWSAPEVDLECGSKQWAPMVPWIASLYLPDAGTRKDKLLVDMLTRITVFLPMLGPPDLLLPSEEAPIPPKDRIQRTIYFVSEMFALTCATCLILEIAQKLSLAVLCLRQRRQESSNTLIHSNYSNLQSKPSNYMESSTKWWLLYVSTFAIYYAAYQCALYVIMDFGVLHGLMNLTTGCVWELWVVFVEMVLATSLLTGIPWYLWNLGVKYESPTALVFLQLMPWLGNEVHIMKDHIAQALCFATAHCYSGQLSVIAETLGYLSFVATILPLFFLFSDPMSARGLRASHWAIPESGIDRAPLNESRQRKFQKKINGLIISACTTDKLTRAMAGELPHGILHLIFAFFFGGSLFIFSAIFLSGAKIFCIPLGRMYLRNAVPRSGCTEIALDVLMTRANISNGLSWDGPEHAILSAFEYHWWSTLDILRVLAPDLDAIFQPGDRKVLKARDIVVVTTPFECGNRTLEEGQTGTIVEVDSDGRAKIKFDTFEEGDVDQVLVHTNVAGDNLMVIEQSSNAFGREYQKFVDLLLNAADTSGADNYIGVLRTLHHKLGLCDKKVTALTLMLVSQGQIPQQCLSCLKEIVELGGSPDVQKFSQQLSHDPSIPASIQAAIQGAVANIAHQANGANTREKAPAETRTKTLKVNYTEDWQETLDSSIGKFVSENEIGPDADLMTYDCKGEEIELGDLFAPEQFPITLTFSEVIVDDDSEGTNPEKAVAIALLIFAIGLPMCLLFTLCIIHRISI